jgi:SagB-type dehydrogenase family enzyme
MTSFLSHLHTELRRARLTRAGATLRPDDVPRGVHKEYPRMELISLPEPEELTSTLQDALASRSSSFSGNPEIPISLQELGTLLGSSLRKRPDVINRNYPSGGALYPIETYVISTALESLTPAVFHYNPTKHALERLWDVPPQFEMKHIAKHPDWLPLSALIVFTSVWKRSSAKYGELSYIHALLEAGHMSENVLLVASGLGLNARPYAGFDDDRIAELLDLDEGNEQSVHTITLCKGGPSTADSGRVADD